MEKIYFGENLKILRKSKGLTQNDIATVFETNKPLISNYELGRHNPPLETLIKIADYFSVSIDALLLHDMSSGSGVNEPPAKYNAKINQINEHGNNHAVYNHTESEWAVMEEKLNSHRQRVKDLEAQIELQKKYIARLEGDVK